MWSLRDSIQAAAEHTDAMPKEKMPSSSCCIEKICENIKYETRYVFPKYNNPVCCLSCDALW